MADDIEERLDRWMEELPQTNPVMNVLKYDIVEEEDLRLFGRIMMHREDVINDLKNEGLNVISIEALSRIVYSRVYEDTGIPMDEAVKKGGYVVHCFYRYRYPHQFVHVGVLL